MAQGVAWVGSDGNIYTRVAGQNGVRNLGSAQGTGILITRPGGQWKGLDLISDPNPPKKSSNNNDNDSTPQVVYSGGSGGASVSAPEPPKLNQAAVDATQDAIDSLGTELDTGYDNINDSYNSVIKGYDKEAKRNKGDYDDSTVTNNSNLQKNKQNALVAAAQGNRGLRSTLAAMGALGGDGLVLANRAVTESANDDIGEAADTFSTNQVTLDKAWSKFDDEDKQRRLEAQTSRNNQRTALEGDIAAKRQKYYQKLAEIYSDAENDDKAADYLDKAGGLNKTIARKSRVKATPISKESAAYEPGDLDDYLAGAGDMTIDVDSGNTTGGDDNGSSTLLARKKDREKELVAA